jgi:hypothetical protein
VYVQAALLVLLKNCHTPLHFFFGDFWDVRAFFLLLCSAIWVGDNRELITAFWKLHPLGAGSN